MTSPRQYAPATDCSLNAPSRPVDGDVRTGAHVAKRRLLAGSAVGVVADGVAAADLACVLTARGTGGDPLDDLGLVGLVGEERRRLRGRELVPLERLVGRDDLVHARLDLLEVVVGERLAVGQLDVVVEAELDRRTDRQLGAGVEVENRLGHHVGGRVPDGVETPFAVAGDDLDRSTLVKRDVQIDLDAVDDSGDRVLGQARTDRCGQVERRRAGREFAG